MTLHDWTDSWTLLAQAPPPAGEPQQTQTQSDGAQGQGNGQPPQSPPGLFGPNFLFILLGLMVVMLVMSSMGQRKERKKREQMLGSLTKHDRVQTMGGVIGTIVDIRDGEVVVKVDESTNTKIRFARSAVQTVLKKSGSSGEEESAQEPQMAQQA